MKWEYTAAKREKCDLETLNALGEESWELVGSDTEYWIFKRRKAEEKTVEVIIEDEADRALFEECWGAYRRRGSKALSKTQWSKLTPKEKDKVLPHIKEYVASVSEARYQVYFERYLRDKRFLDVVYGKEPQTLFSEPQTTKQKEDNVVIGGVIYR